jgi:leader peptidase (prepilin peptidase)/N-methyltransferase
LALRNAALFAGFFALLEFVMTFYVQNIKSRLLNDDSLKEAKSLGEGDIPIVAIIGIVLGIQGGMVAVFLAAIFAIIPSVYYNIKKKDTQLPFIPYLLLGMSVEYFFEISKVFN